MDTKQNALIKTVEKLKQDDGVLPGIAQKISLIFEFAKQLDSYIDADSLSYFWDYDFLGKIRIQTIDNCETTITHHHYAEMNDVYEIGCEQNSDKPPVDLHSLYLTIRNTEPLDPENNLIEKAQHIKESAIDVKIEHHSPTLLQQAKNLVNENEKVIEHDDTKKMFLDHLRAKMMDYGNVAAISRELNGGEDSKSIENKIHKFLKAQVEPSVNSLFDYARVVGEEITFKEKKPVLTILRGLDEDTKRYYITDECWGKSIVYKNQIDSSELFKACVKSKEEFILVCKMITVKEIDYIKSIAKGYDVKVVSVPLDFGKEPGMVSKELIDQWEDYPGEKYYPF